MKAFISRRDFLKVTGLMGAAAARRSSSFGRLLFFWRFRKRLFCRRQDH